MSDEYNQVRRDLEDMQALTTPSEAQGILIGMWIGGGPVAQSRWLDELVGEAGSLSAHQAVPASLHALYSRLYDQLMAADNLGLDLLLPDDDQPLAKRLQGAIDLAQGILYGYGVENGPPPRALTDEVREVFEDLREIAGLDPTTSGTEEDEINLQEIVDYLSPALVVMYISLHPPLPTPAASMRKH